MKIVEITYRFEGQDGPVRERPADAEAARQTVCASRTASVCSPIERSGRRVAAAIR